MAKKPSIAALQAEIPTIPIIQAPPAVITMPPLQDSISQEDKSDLALIKVKLELQKEILKTAVANAQNHELSYTNLILKFAIKYSLKDGDILNDDGTITRKK